ncbi:MAG TPA: 5-formyltetrahydrofolate cyclo-ligase [Flavisolibacter sp.]|nr:5-formyltetrahydrofolate cyclo-ligase [Flavisolibacter sp.]
MNKSEIRKVYKRKRDEITGAQKMRWDDLILIQFQTVELPFLSNVLSFYSIEENNEVNSFLLTDYLHFRNPSLVVAYPRMNTDTTTMQALIASADGAFETNEFGITEPTGSEVLPAADVELVLVPMLAFDAKGRRVGYGKGYYDRYLSACGPDCLKIGVSYFPPIDRIDDAAEFDVPLDLCITPEMVYVF